MRFAFSVCVGRHIQILCELNILISQDVIKGFGTEKDRQKLNYEFGVEKIKLKSFLNDIKKYELIKLFCKTDILLLKSYRKLIYIESLLFNTHRIINT